MASYQTQMIPYLPPLYSSPKNVDKPLLASGELGFSGSFYLTLCVYLTKLIFTTDLTSTLKPQHEDRYRL
jgi:hypothetical protein